MARLTSWPQWTSPAEYLRLWAERGGAAGAEGAEGWGRWGAEGCLALLGGCLAYRGMASGGSGQQQPGDNTGPVTRGRRASG